MLCSIPEKIVQSIKVVVWSWYSVQSLKKMSSYCMPNLANALKMWIFSGEGTNDYSITEVVSLEVLIFVDATPAPATLGIILLGKLDQ